MRSLLRIKGKSFGPAGLALAAHREESCGAPLRMTDWLTWRCLDWDPGKPEAGGGVFGVDIATGKTAWSTPAPKPACLGTPGCSAAQPSPVSAIPGVVFAGSLDGHLRAYDSTIGGIIWDFDTLQQFPDREWDPGATAGRSTAADRSSPEECSFAIPVMPAFPSCPETFCSAFGVEDK